MSGAHDPRSAGRRAALAHVVASAVLLGLAVAAAPAKFERDGPVLAVLALILLAGGAVSARAAWTARALHGVSVPGWSPFDRGWWAWDPPLRAFHWAMCAHALLLMWCVVALAMAFESFLGQRVPVALDAVAAGSGQLLTGLGTSLVVGAGGYALTRHWARRVPA